MNILKEFTIESNCSYLEGKTQIMHHQFIQNCDTLSCGNLIERGFRRFGKNYFRPICMECQECQSIKIDVENFNFSKSRRRVLKKASHIKSYIQKPSMTKEHLALFEKYHLAMRDKKGWEHAPTTPQNYYASFVEGCSDFGYEVLYFLEDRLIGVDLIDILDDGISSIYFYYDPDFMHYSLGKLSLLNQILFAKRVKKRWIYLGYYVKECASLSYKSEYKPYLTLIGRPSFYEEPIYVSKES